MPHVPEYDITFGIKMQEKFCENPKEIFISKKKNSPAVLFFVNRRMPQDAAARYFFTRYVKQAGALQLTFRRPLACLTVRGHDVHV